MGSESSSKSYMSDEGMSRARLVARLKHLALERTLLEQIRQLRHEQHELKQDIREENDLKREQRRRARLQSDLEQAKRNEANLAAECAFGAPDWSGGGGMWGPMQAGEEVVYSARFVEQAGDDSPASDLPDRSGSGVAGNAAGGKLTVRWEHSKHTIQVQVYTKPFAMGALRRAYYARDANGGCWVLKRAIVEHSKLRRNLQEAHLDAESTALCRLLADSFTAELQRASVGQAAAPRVAYVATSIVLLPDTTTAGGQAVYLKEPFLLSDPSLTWHKWTRNDGSILADGKSDECIQSFSHFSHHFTANRLGAARLVLDVQGTKASGPVYSLSDPAICTHDRLHGPTDMGVPAAEKFWSEHSCGTTCAALGCTHELDSPQKS